VCEQLQGPRQPVTALENNPIFPRPGLEKNQSGAEIGDGNTIFMAFALQSGAKEGMKCSCASRGCPSDAQMESDSFAPMGTARPTVPALAEGFIARPEMPRPPMQGRSKEGESTVPDPNPTGNGPSTPAPSAQPPARSARGRCPAKPWRCPTGTESGNGGSGRNPPFKHHQ